jgi:hypothetical protein
MSIYSSLILQIGKTALHLAAEKGHEDTVQLLIGRGSDIKATDAVSHTVSCVCVCVCVSHALYPSLILSFLPSPHFISFLLL